MPVYEYRCLKCGNVFERLQRFSDPAVTVHDECGGTVEKLISRSGFHLKGSGWYATDYAKGSSLKPASESKTDGNSDSKSDSKTDSKTADSKPAESTGESKSAESKSTESKSAEPTSKGD